MKSAIIALMMSSWLSGCGAAHSEAAQRLMTPGVVQYTATQQNQMADEIEAGYCPALNFAMADYSVMRDQARVARGETVKH